MSDSNVGATTITVGSPVLQVVHADDGTPFVRVEADLTNNGPDLADNAVFLSPVAQPTSGQAERDATEFHDLRALAAGSTSPHHVTIQLDPGSWNVTVFAVDQSGNVLGQSDTQSVTVPGHQTNALAFTENTAFQLAIQITALERIGPNQGRVHYNLLNAGSVGVPPGLSVEGVVGDGERLERIPAGLPAPAGCGRGWL